MAERHIGLTIKALREERGLSKSRVAREAGFSDAYLVQIEKGDRNPSEAVLRSIARSLRVPPHHLLIAAGHYDEKTVQSVYDRAHEQGEAVYAARGHVSEEQQDRLVALAFDELEQGRAMEEYYLDPETADEAAKAANPLDVPSDIFWGWNSAKQAWAPEHWNELSDRDRAVVQQLINRLMLIPSK